MKHKHKFDKLTGFCTKCKISLVDYDKTRFNKYKKFNPVELRFLSMITGKQTYFDILNYNFNLLMEERFWIGVDPGGLEWQKGLIKPWQIKDYTIITPQIGPTLFDKFKEAKTELNRIGIKQPLPTIFEMEMKEDFNTSFEGPLIGVVPKTIQEEIKEEDKKKINKWVNIEWE